MNPFKILNNLYNIFKLPKGAIMIRAIIITMLIAASFAFAAEIFGPVSYYRTTGAPEAFS